MQYFKSAGGGLSVPVSDRIIPGYYTSGMVDLQGHIIRRSTMEAAIGDYMEWGTVREMHQNPIGTVADIGTPHWNSIRAKIVNTAEGDKVLQYVREGVYKAFSIGALITDAKLVPISSLEPETLAGLPPAILKSLHETGTVLEITDLVLAEISIVDRPANPAARISEVKNLIGAGFDLGVLPTTVTRDGLDALKGVFPVANSTFFITGTSSTKGVAITTGGTADVKSDTEKALDEVMEENTKMDEINADAEVQEAVEAVVENDAEKSADITEVNEDAATEVTVDSTNDVPVENEAQADESVEKAIETEVETPVEDTVAEKGIGDVLDSIAALKDAVDSLIALVKSAQDVVQANDAEPEKSTDVQKSVAATEIDIDAIVEKVIAAVELKTESTRKATVATPQPDQPQRVDIKSLDANGLRGFIVDAVRKNI